MKAQTIQKNVLPEGKACSKCKQLKDISLFNRRGKKLRSECKECQALDHFNYLCRKRFIKDKLFNASLSVPRKELKSDVYAETFKQISVSDISDRQFIKIPLISANDELKGDPYEAIKMMKEKLKYVMEILAIKRKFAISLLCVLNLVNQRNTEFEHMFETPQRKIESKTEISVALEDVFSEFEQMLENMNLKQSGLVFRDIVAISCKIAKVKVLRGGCSKVKLPPFVLEKKCLFCPKSLHA